jgi:hypothetical protein
MIFNDAKIIRVGHLAFFDRLSRTPLRRFKKNRMSFSSPQFHHLTLLMTSLLRRARETGRPFVDHEHLARIMKKAIRNLQKAKPGGSRWIP